MNYSQWSQLKKREKEREKKKYNSYAEWSNEQLGITEEEKDSALKQREDEIAPVKQEDPSWFQGGAFSDGYQFGDITKTIVGTVADINENINEAVFDATENLIDTGAYVVGAVGGLFDEDFQDEVGEFIAEEILTPKETGEAVATYATPFGWANLLVNGGETEENSVLGDKSDGLVQSASHLVGSYALQIVGVPTWLTMGVNAFGSEVESAFQQGATYGEAGVSAGISAAAEIVFEKISSGINIGGGGTLDDGVQQLLKNGISNKIGRTVAKVAVDAVGEASEEVLTEATTAVARKFTYMDDKEWSEVLSSEDLFDAAIGGAVLGSVANGVRIGKNASDGRDLTTGLTTSEEKVVRKLYEDAIADRPADAKRLTVREKEKLWDEIVERMDKGEISIDTIEEVLGGDDYKSYRNTIETEDALKSELDTLRNTEKGKLTDIQEERLAELKGMNLEDPTKRNEARSKLDNTLSPLLKDSRLMESYNERARKGVAFEADLSKYKGKQKDAVERAVNSGVLNNTRRSHELVEILSKIEADKGIVFDYADNAKLKESGFAVEGKTINGFEKNGTVTLNVQSAKSWQSVVGHEITHVLEGTEAYGALQKALFKYAKSKGELDSRRANLTALYQNIDADIDAELTADLVGDYLFSDSNFIKDLTTNRNLFRRIYDEIKYLCKVATGKELTEIEKVRHEFDKAWKEVSVEVTNEAANEVSDVGTENVKFSIREEAPPKKTIKGYKVFRVVDGKLYPPMVDNPSGNGTPVGVWLNADVGGLAYNKDGSVKLNTEGRFAVASSQGGSLSFRPGWHLGEYPDASQFGRMDTSHPLTEEELATYKGKTYKDKKSGNTYPMNLFPYNFVWAECEVAADRDYQLDAMSLGVNEKGSFVRSRAGLPYVPTDGYYKYRTNPDPNTAPWIISGAIKVNRILDDAEVAEICAQHGVTPQVREGYTNLKKKDGGSRTPGNAINLADFGLESGDVAPTDASVLAEIYNSDGVAKEQSATAMNLLKTLPGYAKRKINFADAKILEEFGMNNQDAEYYRNLAESTKDGYLTDDKLYSGEGVKYSISKETDADYLKAVESGDTETAQIMVDKAAKSAGYTRTLYHGTASKFNVFGFGRSGIYTTDNYDMAKTYGNNVMSLYGKEGAKVLTIDAQGSPHYAIKVSKDILDFSEYPLIGAKETYSTNDISLIAFREGYDVVVINNVYDNYSIASGNENGLGTDIVYKDSNQVKSSEAITYDDKGNVIPLSERFNKNNDDIRYSLSSMANTFYGDESMSSVAFERSDYKQTDGYKNYVEQCVNNMRQTRADFDETVARQEIEKQIDGIVRVALAAKKAGYDILDDASKRDLKDSKNRLLFSSLEPNSDYFTSSDISTICDKRKNFAEIYDEIVKTEEAKGVPQGKRFFDNVDNYFALHKIMADKGLTQPCRQCYVESMRKNLAPMANAFLRLVNETDANNKANDQLYQQSGKNKGTLKSSNAELRQRVLETFEEHPEYGMTASDLTVETLTTEDGLAQLKIQAPLIYEAFNSFYGQSKPKMPKSATPFRFGELTALLTDHKGKIKQSLVDKINSTGGFRLQSYSDFQIQNYTDVLQVIFEAGTLGLNGHAYTKVPAFLDATEGTNLKRNISIFMYKDGNEWKLDKNDSFPYELEEIYDIVNADKSGNTGIIAVSQNKDMSCWIMANDNVAYGIPFHKSGMKMGTVRDTDVKTDDGRIIKGYSGTIDHTKQQTEVWAKANEDHKALTKVKKGINIYEFWDFDNKSNLSKNELIEKNVKAYIDACEEAGYLPKFRDYVMNNGTVLNDVLKYSKELGFVSQDATIEDISFEYKGYTIPYGYYKFLGDFSMFTPDGKASPHETLSLNNYDFDKAEKFFADAEGLRRNEILQQFANGEERQKYRDSDLTAEELEEIVKQKRKEVADSVIAPVKNSLSYEGEQSSTTGTPLQDLYLAPTKGEDTNVPTNDVSEDIAPAVDMDAPSYDEIAPITEEEFNAMQDDLPSIENMEAPPEMDVSYDYSADSITIENKPLKQLVKRIGDSLGLNRAGRQELSVVIQDFSRAKYSTKDELFSEIEKRFGEQYYEQRQEDIAEIKTAIRNKKIYVSPIEKSEFGGAKDYSDFVRRNFGKIRFSKDGISVDQAYEDLRGEWGNVFPEDVVASQDRLKRIAEVANLPIKELVPIPLSKETLQDATDLVYDSVREYHEAERMVAAEEMLDAPIDESLMPPDDESQTVKFANDVEYFPDEISPMTEEEANALQDEKAKADAKLEGEPKTRKQLHSNIINDIKATFSSDGYDFDDVLSKAKNLSTFSTVDNTPQRVMEKALGYKEGQKLADLTVNKVAQNETEGIKWLNSFTDRKNGLLAQISKEYHIKPGSKESAAAQMYAEGFYVAENNDIVAYGDDELEVDFPNENVRWNIKGLASDPRIRQIYDETLDAINKSRTRNAYPEIQKLDNYFLHFRAMDDTFSRLGLPFNPNDIKAKDLPTDLNGVTADLKPGQPYFASAMHRKGKRTSFDLLGGLERYLTSAKNQIYHIDDIQTLRALRNYIADTYGQANGLEGIDALTEEEAQERIEKVYDSHLSTFAKFLNEEANILAGKTALIDRGLEGVIGRRGMTFLDTVRKQVGSNMVGYNISSSLTNFLPVVQTFAKSNKFDFFKAFTQTVSNKIGHIFGKGDSFAENSPVMIRRNGADRFYRTPFQKVGDAGYFLMGAVDNISTEIIARTKFNELTRKGMSEQQAHFETDKWVSRLMGDRSLGQMPQLYNSKTLGFITQFQLEVRNQLDSQFYDTIQEAKVSNEDIQNGLARNAKIAAKVTSTFVQLAVAQHLFGKAFESIAGYNPAFDIIEVLATMFGFDDEEDSEDTALDNIEQGFLALLEDLPYTSSFTGGGRIPISSALPVTEVITGEDSYGNEKPRLETIGEALPYYVLPGGYGQIKKTSQGLGMFSDEHPVAGSYTDSGNLRFPVEDTFGNRVKAGIFGQYANENAREYFDNDYAPLKEKQIQEYIDVEMPISDYWKYRKGLAKQEELEDKFNYINDLDLPIEKKNILINNVVNRKEEVDMSNYGDYDSLEEFDYATKNPDKYALAKSVGGYSAYKTYSNDLYDIKADKDAYGKSISGSRKQKVLNYINQLDADYETKLILFKSEYPSDDTYNWDIINYINNRADLSYEERVAIYTELGFTVKDGYIYWD